MADNLTEPESAQATCAVLASDSTVEQLLGWGGQRLMAQPTTALGADDLAAAKAAARREAAVLLEHVWGQPRASFIAWPERAVPAAATTHYRVLVTRAAQGEPLAYLLGRREFWSLMLRMTPAVLIPRPETELVIERCLALGPARDVPSPAALPYRVCDLGTGSGAIALVLAHERPDWQLIGTDCSAEALAVARLNAQRLGLQRIEFRLGDWFSALAEFAAPARGFDLIASNPPYVADGDPALMRLAHEPSAALTPGPSGFEALATLIDAAPSYLRPDGWLVLEHGAEQGARTREALQAAGFRSIACRRDLAGHERVTEAQWHGDSAYPRVPIPMATR